MYAILAFIPIIVTVVLMVAFNWPAKRALPLAWVLAAIIGVAVLELLKVALQFLGVDANSQYIAIGIVIFVAISLDIRKYVQKK